jgi:hypothetical protein
MSGRCSTPVNQPITQQNWVYETPPRVPQPTVNHHPVVAIPFPADHIDMNRVITGRSLITEEIVSYVIHPLENVMLPIISDISTIYNIDLPHLYSYFGRNFDFDQHPDAAILVF